MYMFEIAEEIHRMMDEGFDYHDIINNAYYMMHDVAPCDGNDDDLGDTITFVDGVMQSYTGRGY